MIKSLSHKNIFLVDTFGALITALMLSLVLARHEPVFGMPATILYILAGIAAVFAVYSFLCHGWCKDQWPKFLLGIALANAAYCLITLGLIIYLYDSLTWLGIAYFAGEIMIVLLLVSLEIRMAMKKVEP